MRKIKKILKLIWEEFIYGGHLLSLGAVSVVFTSSILLNIQITWDCLAVVYVGTLAGCLYGRLKDVDKDSLTNPERSQYLKKYVRYKPLIVFSLILLFAGILLYFNKIPILLFGLLLILLIFLYEEFFKKFTKRIIGFKNFVPSLLFTLLVVLLSLYYSIHFSLSLCLILIFVFLREFIGISFSDIKDIEKDKKEKLLTFAIFFGKEKLIKILSIINLLAILPIVVGFYFNLFPKSSLMLFFPTFYAFYYFKKSKDKNVNPTFLYDVLVDSEDILWSFFILLGNFLV